MKTPACAICGKMKRANHVCKGILKNVSQSIDGTEDSHKRSLFGLQQERKLTMDQADLVHFWVKELTKAMGKSLRIRPVVSNKTGTHYQVRIDLGDVFEVSMFGLPTRRATLTIYPITKDKAEILNRLSSKTIIALTQFLGIRTWDYKNIVSLNEVKKELPRLMNYLTDPKLFKQVLEDYKRRRTTKEVVATEIARKKHISL